MRKGFKSISVFMLVMFLSVFASITTFAASEKRVDLKGGNGSYVTVSNVVEEKTAGSYPLYMANGPVTVKFDGDGLSGQYITYYPKAQLQNDKFTRGTSNELVKFAVKKYINNSNENKIVDALSEGEPFEEVPHHYVTGNYATLSKQGYYIVRATPVDLTEKITDFVIQVTGESDVSNQPQIQPQAQTLPAAPTASNVLVNGTLTAFEAYNIDGNNYFKLRDLAAAVNGTTKNFEVTWDNDKKAISLISGKTYTTVGGELAVSEQQATKDAMTTTSKIYMNGKETQFTAYTIDGNNYFKLRDIAKVMGIGVAWNGSNNSIGVDTNSNYKE